MHSHPLDKIILRDDFSLRKISLTIIVVKKVLVTAAD
jgi:hypothetical protein